MPRRALELLAEEYNIALVLNPDPQIRKEAERLGAAVAEPTRDLEEYIGKKFVN